MTLALENNAIQNEVGFHFICPMNEYSKTWQSPLNFTGTWKAVKAKT